MAYLSLFRKYRPSNFEEIIGQEHIITTLKNALDNKKITHAYLFCGPRGTGKTTSARIFAKALNCEKGITSTPCNKCDMCLSINKGSSLDIIELDAASNTQVDKVREFIIQKVNFSPTSGRYKVYIIDEVHKLSDASFNALLKTLEEPPSHTVFILATTHPHELLPTILSRCQRFNFKRLSLAEIILQLRRVSKNEKIDIEEGALSLIAQSSEGSMRDSIVILEQLASYAGDEIKHSHIYELLGLTDSGLLFDISNIFAENNTLKSLEILEEIINKGFDIEKLCKDMIEFYRRILITKISGSKNFIEFGEDYVKKLEEQTIRYSAARIMNILKILIELKSRLKDTSVNRTLWEMAMVKITKLEAEPSLDKIAEKVFELEEKIKMMPAERENIESVRSPVPIGAGAVKKEKIISPPEIKEEKQPVTKLTEDNTGSTAAGNKEKTNVSKDNWNKILQIIKKEKMSLYAILAEAKTEDGDGYIKLLFKKGYEFHRDKILENKEYLKKLLEKNLMKEINLEAVISDDLTTEHEKEKHDEMVKDVMDIFSS